MFRICCYSRGDHNLFFLLSVLAAILADGDRMWAWLPQLHGYGLVDPWCGSETADPGALDGEGGHLPAATSDHAREYEPEHQGLYHRPTGSREGAREGGRGGGAP